MKQCPFLILLMITPGLAQATDFNALIDQGMNKQQSLHSRVSSNVGSPKEAKPALSKKGTVKSQPLVIKFKLKRSVANLNTKKAKTKLAAKPVDQSKKRTVAASSKGHKVSIAKHEPKKQTKLAQVKKDKKTKIAKSRSNKIKVASVDLKKDKKPVQKNKTVRQKIAANI